MPKSTNKFVAAESYDYEIADANGGGKIGELRLKPSSLLWKPKGAHQYYSVSLSDFAEWAESKNHKVNK